MTLSRIDIRNLRVLESVSLLPGPGVNLVVGANGAGKTSVLEGIYLLGRGRSFRSALPRSFVREGRSCVEVTGWRKGGGAAVAGVRRCVDGTEIRIDGQKVNRVSVLARLFPVQLVTPRSHELLERGPDTRRKFLDWGVFHVERPSYHALAMSYQRLLRQRNEALKSAPGTVSIWDDQLVSAGEAIDQARRRYLPELRKRFDDVADALGLSQEVLLSLYGGWPAGVSLGESLASRCGADHRQGYTSVGPHRADLRVKVSGVRAEVRLSRGQQKLVILALILAQMKTIADVASAQPLLLIDDLAAELDEAARGRVMAFLRSAGGQTFVTSLDERLLGASGDDRLFHVEHGRVSV